MLVIDASSALAWAYADEAGQPDNVIDYVAANGAYVPAHWILEVTNTLLVGEHRNRLKSGQRQQFLAEIASLPIRVDAETSIRGWDVIPALAERHGLSSLDAAYLELAMRLDSPLATLDQAIARAARAEKVALFR